MKKLIVASAILAAAGSASADHWFSDCKPTVGVDFKWTRVKDSGDWQNIFPKNFPGGSIYVTTKFMENFGAELGYDTTTRRTKQTSLVAGNRVGGALVPGSDVIRASVRFAGPHLDLMGIWPLENCVDVFVSLGLGWVKPRVSVVDVAGVAGTNFDRDITSIKGDTKTIARVGLGANWMATNYVGFRIKALWENTSRLRVESTAPAGNQVLTNFKPWKDSYSLAVGVFLKF